MFRSQQNLLPDRRDGMAGGNNVRFFASKRGAGELHPDRQKSGVAQYLTVKEQENNQAKLKITSFSGQFRTFLLQIPSMKTSNIK
jgi:hypothetical protein